MDELLYSHCGRHFAHNIHSVRVLDDIFNYNITLQTLCGIAAHDGEMELKEYRPRPLSGFEEFDAIIENCYTDKTAIKKLVPDTLEGCVVRISDIIAYIGKDRQDAERAHIISEKDFGQTSLGAFNAEIINNLMVNIIEHSYGKDHLCMDEEHFEALKTIKAENYKFVYGSDSARKYIPDVVQPMMKKMYARLLDDLARKDQSAYIFTHHINYVNKSHYRRKSPYEDEQPEQIAADYIACMTDDYFVDLYSQLFPDDDCKILYKGYFD